MRSAVLGALLAGLVLTGSAGAQEFSYGFAPQVNVFVPGSGSFLGVGVADITADRAKALKLKEERGVEITRVEDDSPAAKAGFKVGDVVLEYNGERVEGTEQFMRLVRETPAGRQVRLVISREGATQTLTATIGARKGSTFIGEPFDREKLRAELQANEAKLRAQMEKLREQYRVMPDIPSPNMSWRSGMLGVEAESLNSQLAEFFGVKEGVLVRSVSKDSAAEKAGLKAGDVIIKIDDTKVSTPREITNAIRALRSKNTFPVTVVRNRKEMTVSVTVPADRAEGPVAPKPPAPPRPPGRTVGADTHL
jgi:serine protease Do